MMENINSTTDQKILTIKKQYIGSSTRPELHKCYVDTKGQLFFVCGLASGIGHMDIQYIHEDGHLGSCQSTYYKNQSERTSHGRIKGPERLQCYLCKKNISYKAIIEQKEASKKSIYDNFILSDN